MNDKNDLRIMIRDKRNSMRADEIRNLSNSIQERLIASQVFMQSHVIMAYMPIRNEVMTDLIIKAAYDSGKIVCLPRVSDEIRMEATRVNDPGKQLKLSSLGIPEPDPVIPAFNPANIDLVIIPGIAFDRAGHRIGFGKGYYDRFVPFLKGGCNKVAAAYAFQVLNKIPFEDRDLCVDMIFTDKERIMTANWYSTEVL